MYLTVYDFTVSSLLLTQESNTQMKKQDCSISWNTKLMTLWLHLRCSTYFAWQLYVVVYFIHAVLHVLLLFLLIAWYRYIFAYSYGVVFATSQERVGRGVGVRQNQSLLMCKKGWGRGGWVLVYLNISLLVLDYFVACVCAPINMTCLICYLFILQVYTRHCVVHSSFSPAYCHQCKMLATFSKLSFAAGCA